MAKQSVFFASTFIISILLFVSCHTNDVQTAKRVTDVVTFSQTGNNLVDLTAGGLVITGDTSTFFDFTPNFTLTNSSSASVSVNMSLELGTMQGSTFVRDTDLTIFAISNFDSVQFLAKPGEQIQADSIEPMVVTLRNSARGKSIAYRLTLKSPGLATVQFLDSVTNIPFEKRWRGYIITTETSPDPISIGDPPDDGDWKTISSIQLSPKSAYPNPVISSVTLSFSALSPLDKVWFEIHDTPKHSLGSYGPIQTVAPGTHSIQINLQGMVTGLYRIYIFAEQSGVLYSTYGDVRISP